MSKEYGFTGKLVAFYLMLPHGSQQFQALLCRGLFQLCRGGFQGRRAFFLYQSKQSGKVRNKQRNVMIGRGSNGFIDGFLEAGEALIELKQLSN